MKDISITRPVDALGRIVLPKELRHSLNISSKDRLEIFIEDNSIILQKFSKECLICGSKENIMKFKDKTICTECIKDITDIRLECELNQTKDS